MKRCTKCGETKPDCDFYAAKDTKDGLRGDCKACFSLRSKRWYRANRDRVIARVRHWQLENHEHHLAQQRKYNSARRDVSREDHLRKTFGLTGAAYAIMLADQGGRCAICRREPRAGSSLHVDHDHGTGTVRGLLCFRCNGGLGQFKDDADRLRLAADYVLGDLEPARTRALFRGMAVARARGLIEVAG